MLIREKFKNTAFSPAEESVVAYLLQLELGIEGKTVKEIAAETYTHPSTLIRIANKMGYDGWRHLKEAYIKEIQYLNQNFNNLDANFPFTETDSVMTIASKIAKLEQSTIEDTFSLLHHDDLQKAQNIVTKANSIRIFSTNVNTYLAQDFALKMRRIGKDARVCEIIGEPLYEALNCPANACGILISYTGENSATLQVLRALKMKNIPTITLTSIGNNTMSREADCALRLTTREKLYSKIASYSINTSICYLLDAIYSVTFAENYKKNYQHLKSNSRIADNRTSTIEILKENDEPQ